MRHIQNHATARALLRNCPMVFQRFGGWENVLNGCDERVAAAAGVSIDNDGAYKKVGLTSFSTRLGTGTPPK